MEDWKWVKNKHMAAPMVIKNTPSTVAHMPNWRLCKLHVELHNWPYHKTMENKPSGWPFGVEDAKMIKKIPLSRTATDDLLYWPYLSNGMYSCKSGYKFLKKEVELSDTHQVPPLRDKHLWKAIWSMRVPQKVKTFIWRVCRNVMPTKQALMRRTIIADPICEWRRAAVEDPLHALWSCSELDIYWADPTLGDFCSSIGFVELKQLVLWIVEEGKQLDLFAFTA